MCFKKTDIREWPDNVSYLGVGFGRGSSQQPQALPDKVPFVNVVEIDGVDVQSSIQQGYMLNQTGVTVGLTQESTEPFALAKLDLRNDPTCSVDCDRDWQMVVMHISIDDSVVDHGRALFDTGISQSYVTTGERIYDTLDLEPMGKRWILANGSIVTVTVGEEASPIATYSVKVNDPDSPLNPYEGEFIVSKLPPKATRGPFINTGRHFYKGFGAMLDADCGCFGLRELLIGEIPTEGEQHVQL